MFIEIQIKPNTVPSYLDAKQIKISKCSIKTGSKKHGYKIITYNLIFDHIADDYTLVFKNIKCKKPKTQLSQPDIEHIKSITVTIENLPEKYQDIEITRFTIHTEIKNIDSNILKAIEKPNTVVTINKNIALSYNKTIRFAVYTLQEPLLNKIIIKSSERNTKKINDLFYVLESRFTGSSRYSIQNTNKDKIIIHDTQTDTTFAVTIKQ